MTITIESVPMTREHLTRGRAGGGIRCIVMHATAGTWPGDFEWLRQGGSTAAPVSCHYLISPDGSRVVQFVADHDTAWHAGSSGWTIDDVFRSGLNVWSIGIELSHSNRPSQPHDPRQISAAVELCRMLAQRYDIPRSQLVRHVDISPGRKTDPAALPWPQFVDDVYRTTLLPTPQYTTASPIVGAPLGTILSANRWMASRSRRTDNDDIIRAYRAAASISGVDWFLALAQAHHETGTWTSALSQTHNRDAILLNNPAGIGVTGQSTAGPKPGFVWDADRSQYRASVAFPNIDFAARAHVGRLLAYATDPSQRTTEQQWLVDEAMRWRSLPLHMHGSAITIGDLGGRWAPSPTYGERVADMAERMRRA